MGARGRSWALAGARGGSTARTSMLICFCARRRLRSARPRRAIWRSCAFWSGLKMTSSSSRLRNSGRYVPRSRSSTRSRTSEHARAVSRRRPSGGGAHHGRAHDGGGARPQEPSARAREESGARGARKGSARGERAGGAREGSARGERTVLLVRVALGLDDGRRADVGGEDDDGVAEVDGAPLPVGDAPVVEHLTTGRTAVGGARRVCAGERVWDPRARARVRVRGGRGRGLG